VRLERASSIISTEPWGKADQPVYANAVARMRTSLQPLAICWHTCARWNARAGRERRERWGARTLDLDILDYNGIMLNAEAGQSTDAELVLPHPSMHEREFVLAPIAEIAPRWRHPVLRKTAKQLLAGLDNSQGGNIISRDGA
jgi:2-amino-4-hydroxy-6-hydroxymethyldihydropteridine diphosphokinase